MKCTIKYLLSIFIGAGVGIITVIGQKYLPINLNFLANSGAVWLIPAYLLSYYLNLGRRDSILISICCLVFSVFGYYIFESVINHHNFHFGGLMYIWLIYALISGVIFGLGAYFANNKNGCFQYVGRNLLPATFLSEGFNKIIHIKEYSHMVPAVIMVTSIGVIMYLILNKKDAFKRNNIFLFIGLMIVGLLFYELVFILV